jgi:multiple sugar transport system substrate-binding protein
VTVLRGMTWEHSRGYECMVACAREYARLTDVRVEWEYRSLQAFADEPLARLAATYDLLVIDHPHIPLAADEGILAPLDGVGYDDQLHRLAGQSVGPSHESYRHGGHQYGLASDAAAQVSAFRPDLLPVPPPGWEEVLDLARAGRVLWPAKPIDAFSSLMTLAANNGTPPATEPGVFLTADQAAPVLDRLRELAAHVPEWCLGANPIEVAEALADGDQWAYSPLMFGYTNYSRPGYRPRRLRYVDIPSGTEGVRGALLGGAGVAVSAASENLGAARAFAFWVSSAEVQATVYYAGGGQPGNAVAWEDEAVNRDCWDFFVGTRATLEGAHVRPRTPGYLRFQDEASPWVTEALQGGMDDATLVDRLNGLAARLLAHPAGRGPDATGEPT